MMGSEDIDLGLGNVWNAWFEFRKGKRMSMAMHEFQYNLEINLMELHQDLVNSTYKHGPYRHFIVCDNKRREISVSLVRDRVVHRLLYDYLVPIWDKTFIYDAWSCRRGKGLLAAIERTQKFLKAYPQAYVWRADVQKFFDSVDQRVLFELLKRRVKDRTAMLLIREVLKSHQSSREGVGMPIGNLTSQIFSNIYLNELDRFVKHTLQPKAYLRYGDDFLLFEMDLEKLEDMKEAVTTFLANELKLTLHTKNNVLVKACHGLKFLGVELWSSGRRLSKRNKVRIANRLNLKNVPSYHGVLAKHGSPKLKKWLDWKVHELIC
ncbi:MAG: RNA-directed DNA polymerase [Oceanicoccus sp.]|jgi:RNA-directed DNA polymerase